MIIILILHVINGGFSRTSFRITLKSMHYLSLIDYWHEEILERIYSFNIFSSFYVERVHAFESGWNNSDTKLALT